MAKRARDVRIGTSGWNYPAPGDGPWAGVFYPLKQGQIIAGTKVKFDELAYYANRFNTVEINNTFYRPPAVRVAQSWAKRTPPNFEFSLKLLQDFTHKLLRARLLPVSPAGSILSQDRRCRLSRV